MDDDFGTYEAEARAILALQREQRELQLQMGLDAGGPADDDEMYEECEEQEEDYEDIARTNAIVSAAAAGSSSAGMPQSSSLAVNNVDSKAQKAAATAKLATSTVGPSGVKPSAKVRSGSARPRVVGTVAKPASGGVLPSPRKRGAPGAEAQPAKPRRRRVKEKKKVVLNCNLSKYSLIRELANDFGYVLDDDEELEKFAFNLIWADTVLPLQKLARLSNWQRFNHFPSMHLLCRKGHLGLTLGRMRRSFPDDYAFFPRTWALRSEKPQFAKHLQQQGPKKQIYIMKPNAGCQGRGIILTKDPLNAVEDVENFIVQEYVMRPLLIESKKFDLRVYVLVTSVRHLSIMVYYDGLVRICAEPYQKPTDANMGNTCIHLTNYAVNKHSDQFVFNTDAQNSSVGNKRDFGFLNNWLTAEGHDVNVFWAGVDDAIVKAVIAALPRLQHVYSSVFPHSNDGYTCFEVLGFDVMVDEKLRPWLLEVNHTPSFNTDTPLDHRIKKGLLKEVWSIVKVQGSDKARHIARDKALRAKRLGAPSLAGDDSMLFSSSMANPDGAAGGGTPNAADGIGSGIADAIDPQAIIALENARKQNFRRAYPHADPAIQGKYEALIRGAREASEDPHKTTAAQEARQNEIKAERIHRESRLEAERLLVGKKSDAQATTSFAAAQQPPSAGPSGPPASSSGGATDGHTVAAGAKQWANQLRTSSSFPPPAPPSNGGGSFLLSHHSPSSSAPASSPSEPLSSASVSLESPSVLPRGRSKRRVSAIDVASMDVQPSAPAVGAQQHTQSAPPRSTGRQNVTSSTAVEVTPSAPNTPPNITARPPGAVLRSPIPPGQSPPAATTNVGLNKRDAIGVAPDSKALRDRLHEQMEKHRRRMILGPRLSVFQLRDTQLEALLMEETQFHAPAHLRDVAVPPIATGRSGATSNAATADGLSMPAPNTATVIGLSSAAALRTNPPSAAVSQAMVSGRSAACPGPTHRPPHYTQALETASAQTTSQAAGPNGSGGSSPVQPSAMAVSASNLQSHWLYHYDAA
jgi:hypothetical protein